MQVAIRLIQVMVAVGAVLLVESTALAQAIVPTNSAPNPYRAIENWAKLPEGRTWGSTNAVDIDRDGVSVCRALRFICAALNDEAGPPVRLLGLAVAANPEIRCLRQLGEKLRRWHAGVAALHPYRRRGQRLGRRWVGQGRQRSSGHQVQS